MLTREQAILALERVQAVVHDLKTPLSIIGVLRQELEAAPGLTKPMAGCLEKMRKSHMRTTELLLSLFDIEMLTESAICPKPVSCDIVAVIEEAALSAQALASRKKILITFESPVDELLADIDKSLLERMVLNLVSNAVKFTRHGGEICVSLGFDGDAVSVAVKDNGVGFYDYELLSPFARCRPGRTDINPDGSGIGLASTRDMAEALGGTICARNGEGGGGAHITVTLPLAANRGQLMLEPMM